MLPRYAAMIEQQLLEIEAAIVAAETAEQERQRQNRTAALTGALDRGADVTLDDLRYLLRLAEADRTLLTPARGERVDAQLLRIIEPRRETFTRETTGSPTLGHIDRLETRLLDDLKPFDRYAAVRSFRDEVAALRRELRESQLAAIDEQITGATTAATIMQAARDIEDLQDVPALRSDVPEKRTALRAQAEIWVTGRLAELDAAAEDAAAEPPARASATATAAEPAPSAPLSAAALLGGFAQPSSVPTTDPPTTPAAVTHPVFSGDQLNHEQLLQALYDGNFEAAYLSGRSRAIYVIQELTVYYSDACSEILPEGMHRFVTRARTPAGLREGTQEGLMRAGAAAIQRSLEMIQNPGDAIYQAGRAEELQNEAWADAAALGEAFGCPGEGLRVIFENGYAFMRNPTRGVSPDALTLQDACRISDTYSGRNEAAYCTCAMRIVQSRVPEGFLRYIKFNPQAHLRDVWRMFPHVAREQQRCHRL